MDVVDECVVYMLCIGVVGGCVASELKAKGKFLYSAVSSPQDRSKRITLYFHDIPIHSDTISASLGSCGWMLWMDVVGGCCGWMLWVDVVDGCCGWMLWMDVDGGCCGWMLWVDVVYGCCVWMLCMGVVWMLWVDVMGIYCG